MASQVIEDVAAVGEEFRKTAEAASEHVRRTVSEAQEQFEQRFTEARQAQGQFTQSVLHVSEQNSRFANAAFNGFWDAWLAAVSATAWGQEQVERGLSQAIEQGRLNRAEAAALLRDNAEHLRRQQAELYRLGEESLRAGLEAFTPAGPEGTPVNGKAGR
jgi:hypothetical protein